MTPLDITFALSAFATLFVVIDPVGQVPLFVALTQGISAQKRRAIALRACVFAVIILALFGLAGDALLGALGISMAAFRIAGGLLLFLIALEMLFEIRSKRRDGRADDSEDDPSVFPLAIPLIAGPGSIASMILLVGQADGNWAMTLAVYAMMMAAVLCVLALYLLGGFLERALGRTGIVVTTRLFGMLLAALSVQFVLDGLRGSGLV